MFLYTFGIIWYLLVSFKLIEDMSYTVPVMFYLPIYPCVHRALTVCSLALSAPFALTLHKAITLRSPFVQRSLIVQSVFIHFHSGLQSLCKPPKKKNPCVKVESYFTHQKHHFNQNLIHITRVHILVKVGNYMYKIWGFFLKKTFWLK